MNRHDGTFITWVLLLVLSGLADAAVGVAMRAGLLWAKRYPPRDRQRGRAG